MELRCLNCGTAPRVPVQGYDHLMQRLATLCLLCAVVLVGDTGSSARSGAASAKSEAAGGEVKIGFCAVGDRPTSPLVAPEERATVLGCSQTGDGRALELYGVADASGAGPCLGLAGLPGGTRACGRAPSERVPEVRRALGGPQFVRRFPRGRIEVYGETTAKVDRVSVSYRLRGGGLRRRAATLIQARNPEALAKAGVRKPFGYFVGLVPPRARQITAEARDYSGKILARFGYDAAVRSWNPTVFIARKG